MINLIREGLIPKLDSTKRFNGHFTLHEESVATHSFWVVFYSNLLFRDLFYMAFWEKQGSDDMDWVSLYFYMYNFVIRQSINHDVDEVFTSDVLYHAKYHEKGGDDIRKGLRNIILTEINSLPSSVLKRELKAHLTSDTQEGIGGVMLSDEQKAICHTIVKLCDWLSSYHFSWQEVSCGNKTFESILVTARDGLRTCRVSLLQALEQAKIPYSSSVLETLI